MNTTTVGGLIEQNVRVIRSCQWCKDGGDVDLQRIVREKGSNFSMLDRLPLCTNGDCRGMIRFQALRGMRSEWLMTPNGHARFQAHSDWMFQTKAIEIRREALKRRTPPAGRGEGRTL